LVIFKFFFFKKYITTFLTYKERKYKNFFFPFFKYRSFFFFFKKKRKKKLKKFFIFLKKYKKFFIKIFHFKKFSIKFQDIIYLFYKYKNIIFKIIKLLKINFYILKKIKNIKNKKKKLFLKNFFTNKVNKLEILKKSKIFKNFLILFFKKIKLKVLKKKNNININNKIKSIINIKFLKVLNIMNKYIYYAKQYHNFNKIKKFLFKIKIKIIKIQLFNKYFKKLIFIILIIKHLKEMYVFYLKKYNNEFKFSVKKRLVKKLKKIKNVILKYKFLFKKIYIFKNKKINVIRKNNIINFFLKKKNKIIKN
jgi:hypothetical protein